jgi:hypothetical protein
MAEIYVAIPTRAEYEDRLRARDLPSRVEALLVTFCARVDGSDPVTLASCREIIRDDAGRPTGVGEEAFGGLSSDRIVAALFSLLPAQTPAAADREAAMASFLASGAVLIPLGPDPMKGGTSVH